MSALFDIPKLCGYSKDNDLSTYLKQVTGSLGVSNIFNPSFHIDSDIKILAFRAIPIGTKTITSYVSIETKQSHVVHNISSSYADKLGEKVLDDPKVCKLNDGIYITFNSGWNPSGQNNIYVMKVHPTLESPKLVTYPKRQDHERNWAFFSEKGQVYALYSVEPLVVLKLAELTSKTMAFEEFYKQDRSSSLQNKFTLGTQLTEYKGKYYFVAHRKYFFLQKKLYVGKLCRFDFAQMKIKKTKWLLIHSLTSLLGHFPRHNTQLISCTYFSGIQIREKKMTLGYGVNDVKARFSTHQLSTFFPI
jgi:hypothetical protein